MLPVLLACAAPSGDAYTLNVDIQLPPNQLGLFDEIDSMELVVEAGGSSTSYELDTLSAGARAEIVGVDPLIEATISLVGYSSGEVVAFGRSEQLKHNQGELDIAVLLARVDDFAWVEMAQASALGAVAATGTGSFMLFGGADGRVAATTEDITLLDGVWRLPVAPPSADFQLADVGAVLPPMTSESFEYGDTPDSDGRLGLSATQLRTTGGILVTGGSSHYSDYNLVSSGAWVWNPDDSFTAVGPLNVPRMLHQSAIGPTGQVLLYGGYGIAQTSYIDPLDDLEIYDPVSQTFTHISDNLSSPMTGAGAAKLGDTGVLICGGLKLNSSADVAPSDECDLIGIEGSIDSVPPMSAGLVYPQLVALEDGSVMVTGGFKGEAGEYVSQSSRLVATDETWIYQDGSWIGPIAMHNPRALHAATALPDGRVLVAGGVVEASNYFSLYNTDPLACAEIFDPQTGLWDEVSPCTESDGQASLPLQMSMPAFGADSDYGVLIAGGYDADGYAIAGAAYFVGEPDL